MGLRRFHSKFATSHCATGKMMQIRKRWAHSKCPRCGAEMENTKHVCQCNDPQAKAIFTKGIRNLATWMKEVDSDPRVATLIITLLRQWANAGTPPATPLGHASLAAAMGAQISLGGWNTLLGRISRKITDNQSNRYRAKKSRRSGFRWTVALIKKLQGIVWDMWDHRNAVLANEPTRHHMRDEAQQADQAIESEWTKGDRGLLAQDRFLFHSRKGVNSKNLANKWEWLTSVTTARAAAAEDAANRNNYEHERRGLRRWLLRNQTNQQRTRDGPQTSNNHQTTTETSENPTETPQTSNNPTENNRKRRLHVPASSARSKSKRNQNGRQAGRSIR